MTSPHGTPSRYTNGACRCLRCKAAWAATGASQRARRYRHVAVHGLPSSVEHGHSAYVNWGCRCGICTAAHAQAQAKA